MILENLTLENFGLFRGRQELRFANEYPQNVTVIVGGPCSGKSTLIRAIRWALFGTVNKCYTSHLIHERAARQNDASAQARVSVTLTFRYGGRRFQVERQMDLEQQTTGRSDFSVSADDFSIKELRNREAQEFVLSVIGETTFKALLLDGDSELLLRDLRPEFIASSDLSDLVAHHQKAQGVIAAIRRYVLDDRSVELPSLSSDELSSLEAIHALRQLPYDVRSSAGRNVLALSVASILGLLGASIDGQAAKGQISGEQNPLFFDHFLGVFDRYAQDAVTRAMAGISLQQVLLISPSHQLGRPFFSSNRIGQKYQLLPHSPRAPFGGDESEFDFDGMKLAYGKEAPETFSEILELRKQEAETV